MHVSLSFISKKKVNNKSSKLIHRRSCQKRSTPGIMIATMQKSCFLLVQAFLLVCSSSCQSSLCDLRSQWPYSMHVSGAVGHTSSCCLSTSDASLSISAAASRRRCSALSSSALRCSSMEARSCRGAGGLCCSPPGPLSMVSSSCMRSRAHCLAKTSFSCVHLHKLLLRALQIISIAVHFTMCILLPSWQAHMHAGPMLYSKPAVQEIAKL